MARGQQGRAQMDPPDQTFTEDPDRRMAGDDDDGEAASHSPEHNMSERLKALDGLLDEWVALQNKEDALIKKHIDPIRKKKAAVKADAKKDYEVPTEAFNARAALRRIELKDDADEVVVALNELFEATPVGKSVDLFAAAERVKQKKAEKEAAAEEKKKAKHTETEL